MHPGQVDDIRDLSAARRARRPVPPLVADELALRAERLAPRAARHWVMHTVAGEGVVGSCNQVIELLTGELVSNAVQHGPAGGDLRIGVGIDGAMVRVSVRDEGAGQPRLEALDVTAPSGRGLVLVEVLSSAWGTVIHADGGKTVWFEVDTAS